MAAPQTTRPAPVVALPQHDPEALRVALERSLGRVAPLVHIPLLVAPAGYAVASAAGSTSIPGTKRQINTADATLNHLRFSVEGKTAAAGPITVTLYDITAAKALATVQLTTTTALKTSLWLPLALFNSDHTLEVRVAGDGANAQTLYSASADFRTLSHQP